VKLFEYKDTPQAVYIIMEYCNGGDLHDYMSTHGALDEDTVCHFMRQVAEALKTLHTKNVLHRDIKPQNLLLTHSGAAKPSVYDITIKLADFGFARSLAENSMAETTCGSPMYMAPEVIMCLQYTSKADVWSIGVIIFQCLTQHPPFLCHNPAMLKKYYMDHDHLIPPLPKGSTRELRDLIHQLFQKNANQRLSSIDMLAHPFFNPPSPTVVHTSPSPLSVQAQPPIAVRKRRTWKRSMCWYLKMCLIRTA
jgi:serine/threonine-protein kinase ULK/ATG1